MFRKPWIIGIVILLSYSLCVLFPPVRVVETPAWRWSANNLKQIAYSLHNYHDVYKRFPPAVVRDKDGKPLYSWRVAILRVMGHDSLYKEFKLDEPWDSPHNIRLLEKMPHEYSSDFPGTAPSHATHYQVFVGPGTMFEGPRLTMSDIPDGADKTILVVEAGEPVPWTKPADLTYDPNGPLPVLGGLFSKPGFNAAFADGSVRFTGAAADERTLRALITRNGGEEVDLSLLD